MPASRQWRLGGWLIAAVLSGCAPSMPPHTYLLGAPPDGRPIDRVLMGHSVVEVRPVIVPNFLDTRDIVIRTAAQEIAIDRQGQWADRLSVGIARALTGSLARLLDTMQVTSSPPVEPATWRVLVDVDGFDLGQGSRGLLSARWSIVRVGDGKVVDQQAVRLVTHPSGPGDEAAVVAMTGAIGELAGGIAASLRTAR